MVRESVLWDGKFYCHAAEKFRILQVKRDNSIFDSTNSNAWRFRCVAPRGRRALRQADCVDTLLREAAGEADGVLR